MKVYSVVGSVQYEGDDLLGIFASREDALKFIEAQKESMFYEQYGIVKSELGQPVDVDLMADWI